jgi:SAM-dependent methyltransferase
VSASEPSSVDEPDNVRQRYARRTSFDPRYSLLSPATWQSVFERQRAIVQMLAKRANAPLDELRLVDVGCGEGGSLLEFLRIGLQPRNLSGIELLEHRLAAARERLPTSLALHGGDAMVAPIGAETQDIAYQSVVFSSLLDDGFQQRLAERMWQWLRPGGAVLWYDFIYDNPTNPDVRGVPLRRVRELFPGGIITARRITLAPPIARRVAAVHPALYTMFNAMPLLRTHVLAWIAKPARTCLGKVMTP